MEKSKDGVSDNSKEESNTRAEVGRGKGLICRRKVMNDMLTRNEELDDNHSIPLYQFQGDKHFKRRRGSLKKAGSQ